MLESQAKDWQEHGGGLYSENHKEKDILACSLSSRIPVYRRMYPMFEVREIVLSLKAECLVFRAQRIFFIRGLCFG